MRSDPAPATHRLVVSASARARQDWAADWVAARAADARAIVLAPSPEAGTRVLRLAARGRPAAFGWQRVTLSELASRLAATRLADAGRAPVARVVVEGICARMVHELRADDALGRYAPVGERPGLPRALARTFAELSLAGVAPDAERLEPDLRRLYASFRRELADAGIAERADVLRAAIARIEDPAPHPLLDAPVLVFDAPLRHALEGELIGALAARGPVDAVAPAGDRSARRRLEGALGVEASTLPASGDDGSLGRLRAQLFEDVREGAPLDDRVEVLSAPGESRECVEILRRVRAAAAEGVPFDRMAVLVHAPARYRAHLVEACRRADVPAWLSRGTVRPDPAGRALLALLTCRAEGLSARAFAEYLSLGVVPDPRPDDAPPADVPWLPPDDELLPLPRLDDALPPDEPDEDGELDPDAAVIRGSLRAPWRWERLIVEAAVIGGADRWRRRIDALGRGLAAQIEGLEDPDAPEADGLRARRRDLAQLATFALPLLEALERLPERATWGGWLDALEELALRAVRRPERVLSVLRELAPMGPIGPVGLTEVIVVLSRRLTEMVQRPTGSPAGKLFVASTDEVRGLSFDVVFVPGLAEKVFPRAVSEDPIALDAVREALSPELATTETRVEQERLALRLAVGAAERRLVLSYPRLDTGRGRPRVPSFYGLEVLRAIEGDLPSFEALASRAEAAGGARMAWPAPDDPEDAIDGGEYDLAVLAEHLFAADPRGRDGAARYLMDANPHLARALRARWSRWSDGWTRHDGIVNPSEEAKAALAAYRLDARPYSPTALQSFASCPYRFYLRTVWRLEPREAPAALEELDPLVRGKLVHEIQRVCLERLRDEGALPVTDARLARAHAHLDAAVEAVGDRFREELAPAIPRVFDDGLAAIRMDLSEWLHRMAERPDWVPARFELAFGLPRRDDRDPASVEEPVRLEEGLSIRGAIDLVEERDGALRATDHKTGAALPGGGILRGGTVLQPVLYARALAALFPDREVVGGRLYFCTSRGRYEERSVELGDASRQALGVLVDTIGKHLDRAFLPAAPDDGACRRCDYAPVCGPAEERRVRRKHRQHLGPLRVLRKQP